MKNAVEIIFGFFSIHKTWSDEKLISWRACQKKGVLHHIFIKGILLFGGIIFLPSIFLHHQGYDPATSYFSYEGALIAKLALFSVLGGLFGILTWYSTQASFYRYVEQKSAQI
jgi:hypothetical protein